MSSPRIHRATSKDGTQITARIRGEGPPLLLLPAGPGDAETTWNPVLPHVSTRFTCYTMDTRGRGWSADHSDHTPGALVRDVIDFVESIGEPVRLVEWGTALWALVAAENNPAITAVAAYDPGADEVMNDEIAATFERVFTRAGELAAEGRLRDAAQTFIDHSPIIYGEQELKEGTPQRFWYAVARNIPVFLEEQAKLREAGRSPTSPSVLAKADVPVLLLYGARSCQWFRDSIRHVERYLPRSTVREVPNAEHFGPHTAPRAVADEIVRFFEKPTPR